jgi:serine/threonine protein kinase
MMYYALSGQPPFTGETAFAIMMAHARDPVPPLSEVHPGVPADLEQVVLRCLAKKPADRFPNVRALGDALVACASASEWGANRADAWWAAESIDAREPSPAFEPGPALA